MIDWAAVDARLRPLAAQAAPARLLSLDVALPALPQPNLAAADDWCAWQRPAQELRLWGFGAAFHVTSAGAGRFCALDAAWRGLCAHWRHDGVAPRAFLGFAFAPAGGEPLPNARLWVPELLLCAEQGKTRLTLATPAAAAATAPRRWQAAWRRLFAPAAVPPAPTFRIKRHRLAEEAFLARGRAALAAIATGRLSKLVLTRSLALELAAPLEPAALIATLAAQQPGCAIYGIGRGPASFIGASPETLLAADGESICVDALAGTAWPEAARALDDEKNRREHECVATAIRAALEGLASGIAMPAAPEVMSLAGLTHLRRRITAKRRPAVSLFDLVARLFPTPAIGGAPTPAALAWLAAHGEERSAWYTGGLGWLDAAGDGDIAIALRCGLFAGNAATLHAGAGFVAGSVPEQELAETEAKLATLLEALAALRRRQEAAA
ncbi:MAG: chorismate-binding protein [Rhodocyclaceae bacterium]|nr:chorismate-binding protein [Rhodocyclaceae bacterium]